MESFGARLKREREQRKMTLDDISVSTKIGTRFLVALEEEHFDQLPGGIFNKGFVRAYARHLGIDENQAIADFVAASAPIVPEIAPEETLQCWPPWRFGCRKARRSAAITTASPGVSWRQGS